MTSLVGGAWAAAVRDRDTPTSRARLRTGLTNEAGGFFMSALLFRCCFAMRTYWMSLAGGARLRDDDP